MKRPTINLLSVQLQGLKNLFQPIEIRFHKNKSPDSYDPTNDRVRAIYGPNGSGKTALMTGVWLAIGLLRNGNLIPSLGPLYFSNLLNKEHPIFSFSADFCELKEDSPTHSHSVGKSYRYSVVIDGTNQNDVHISQESFFRFNGRYGKSKPILIFESNEGRLNLFGQFDKKIEEQGQNIVRLESFLPFLVGYLIRNKQTTFPSEDLSRLHQFAQSIAVILNQEDTHSFYFDFVRKRAIGKPEADFLLTDDGKPRGTEIFYRVQKDAIQDFRVFLSKKADFIRLFKPELKSITCQEREERDYYICSEILDYGSYRISVDFESAGIQRLMHLYQVLSQTAHGAILFIDEFDTSISGQYLQSLVQYMNEYGTGQLCFTAHNLEPMKALADNSGSVYFLGENNEVTEWKKNAHYKPYILYPEGMIRGIDFDIDLFDFIRVFGK